METVPSPADAPAHSASTAAAAEIQLEARPAATAVPSHRSNPTDLEIELVHPAASPLELEQYGGGQTSVQVREMEPKDPATKPGSSPIGSIEIELVRSDADKSMTMTLRDGKVPSPRSCQFHKHVTFEPPHMTIMLWGCHSNALATRCNLSMNMSPS